MTVILDQFLQTLREGGLMTEGEIGDFLIAWAPQQRPQTGEDLARLLHRQKKLTKFQVQAIYQGKTKGLVVGNYVVLDKIGQGGMGHVYKAQHKRMKRVVALKVLPSAVAKSPEAVRRFQGSVFPLRYPGLQRCRPEDARLWRPGEDGLRRIYWVIQLGDAHTPQWGYSAPLCSFYTGGAARWTECAAWPKSAN